MFSPNDVGLQYPLQYKTYHGRHVICDKDGRELFLIDVIRFSLEARRWIEEWGRAICEKFNNNNGTKNEEQVATFTNLDRVKMSSKVEDNGKIEIVKRKRGRPCKDAK